MKIRFIFFKGYKFCAKEEINDARKTVSPRFYLNEMDVYLVGLEWCGAVLAIISTPVWIQFTNYLCCLGSLRFKYQVNPIICSLPSLPESSVFYGKKKHKGYQ